MTSPKEAADAVLVARAQRVVNAVFLVIDAAKAGNQEAIDLCEKVKKAAAQNPPEYDRLLHLQAVSALFAIGAMRFERP